MNGVVAIIERQIERLVDGGTVPEAKKTDLADLTALVEHANVIVTTTTIDVAINTDD